VVLGSAGKVIPTVTDAIALERKTALEAGNIYCAGHLEIDCWFHCPAPIPSYKFAK
jgi:hypothetical protein